MKSTCIVAVALAGAFVLAGCAGRPVRTGGAPVGEPGSAPTGTGGTTDVPGPGGAVGGTATGPTGTPTTTGPTGSTSVAGTSGAGQGTASTPAGTGIGITGGTESRSPARATAAGEPTANQTFIVEAAAADLAEIQLGELAQQRAANPAVRAFARRMVQDHTSAHQQLSRLAAGQVTMPSTLDREHEEAKARLAQQTGAEFDRQYLALMVRDHQHAVELFRHQAGSTTPSPLRAFAQTLLPKLEEHLRMAQELEARK